MSSSFDAVIFDLDGVITRTAAVHASAWKKSFDEFLQARALSKNEVFKEFTNEDYLAYVDGKPRYNGVDSFLRSRGIELEWGNPSNTPEQETVCGIGNRKNNAFVEVLERDGAEVFESSLEFIKVLHEHGIKTAVASSSKNCLPILLKAEIANLFEARVDGVISAELNLNGKPEPDIFLRAAMLIGVHPSRAIVVEDAVSGVAAGRNGGFALVLGIARENNADELLQNGADIVVEDLSQISYEQCLNWFNSEASLAYDVWVDIKKERAGFNINTFPMLNKNIVLSVQEMLCGKRKPVFFLDYDGTLTPIVSRPEDAIISSSMRETVEELIKHFSVTIVSGRCRDDVEKLLGIKGITYAGSHGFDILGPKIQKINHNAEKMIPVIAEILSKVKEQIGGIEGVIIEDKKFSMAAHYRLADEEKYFHEIQTCMEEMIIGKRGLRLMHGKKVFEILPALDWDKGKAVRFVVEAMGHSWEKDCIVYIGDDTTDEDAYRVLRGRGCAINVSDKSLPSFANFRLENPTKVEEFFKKLIMHWKK